MVTIRMCKAFVYMYCVYFVHVALAILTRNPAAYEALKNSDIVQLPS